MIYGDLGFVATHEGFKLKLNQASAMIHERS